MKIDKIDKWKDLLKKYNRLEEVEQDWIDLGEWVLDKMEVLRKEIDKKGIDGLRQITKTGYTQKTGEVQSLDSMIGIWQKVSMELGLSQRGRDKWQPPKPKEKDKNKLFK